MLSSMNSLLIQIHKLSSPSLGISDARSYSLMSRVSLPEDYLTVIKLLKFGFNKLN